MVQGFRDLRVYNDAIELTKRVYQLVKRFSKQEQYILVDQLLRAVNSVGANIAEGHGRFHQKEFAKFLYNARGSLMEVLHHLNVAKELHYITADDFTGLEHAINDLAIRMNNLINSVKKTF